MKGLALAAVLLALVACDAGSSGTDGAPAPVLVGGASRTLPPGGATAAPGTFRGSTGAGTGAGVPVGATQPPSAATDSPDRRELGRTRK